MNATAATTTTTVGRFTYDATTGQIAGPEAYMAERYAARMAAIYAGRDTVFNMAPAGSNPVVAVLVSLQTDYAAWLGARQLDSMMRRSA